MPDSSSHSCLLRLVLPVLLATAGCAGVETRSQTLPGYAAVGLEQAAMMPFLPGRADLAGQDTLVSPLDCSLEALCVLVNELEPEAEAVMNREAHAALAGLLGERLVPLPQTERVYDGMARDLKSDTPRSLARRLGGLVDADHVVLGAVWRYRERTPSQGASVGFSLYLLEVETGRRVWWGRFDRTQVELTEDVSDIGGFFRRGGRWLSAEEYARYGIERVLETFPDIPPPP